MAMIYFFQWFNQIIALPATILFFCAGIILTIKTGFLQFRALPRFFTLVKKAVRYRSKGDSHVMSPLQALFTAMGTTIGMGNIVGPSIAIFSGGPGALFWLLVYIFFGSVTKFCEVTFALKTRRVTNDGHIIGGPMEYLKQVHPLLAHWYVGAMMFLFMGWSGVQSNTLAHVFALQSIPPWIVGALLAVIVVIVLHGGVTRVGAIASKLVPFMFFLYVFFSLYILSADISGVRNAFALMYEYAFHKTAAFGGFVGSTVFYAMRSGVYRGIFITEAGLGTSSIAHAVADNDRAVDQGILALFSMLSDAMLSLISGLLILVTGVWSHGVFRSTLIYEAFQLHAPAYGKIILLLTMTLFVITTVIGNSFNGTQSFSSVTEHKGVGYYVALTAMVIFAGSMVKVTLIWEMMDTILTLVAIPNVIGLLVLSFTDAKTLSINRKAINR